MIVRSIAALSLILLSTVGTHAEAATATPRLAPADCDTPSYRNTWQQDELQGAVKVAVLVDASGKVQQTKVVSSSGYAALDGASLRASTSCKFKPVTSGSAPVWEEVQYKWVLN